MTRACGDCRFYAPLSATTGECRCYTPDVSDFGFTRWPRVAPAAWCGLFEPQRQPPPPPKERSGAATFFVGMLVGAMALIGILGGLGVFSEREPVRIELAPPMRSLPESNEFYQWRYLHK